MNAERARAFLHTLSHVVETLQWGNNLVFWVGDKAIGGKMFVLVDLDSPTRVISYAAGPEHYAELLEQEGLLPAPYLARIFWVAAETWSAHRDLVWEAELRAAHVLTLNKLPARTRTLLALPAAQQKRLIADRRKALAAKAQQPPTPSARTSKRVSTNSTAPRRS